VSIKLLAITGDSPYPPNRGGRVDQWGRFQLFKANQCRLMLVSWYVKPDNSPSASQRAALREVFDDVHLFPIDQTLPMMLRRLIMLPKYSPHISTRILSAVEEDAVFSAACKFAPDAIWLDSLYGGVLAERLGRRLNVPIFYRSHNIEFKYIRSQASQALTLRDMCAWKLACTKLKSFEMAVQKNSELVFDISCDDLDFWRSKGIAHNVWAPPLLAQDPTIDNAPIPYKNRAFDIVFLGNLFAPNNIRGIEWFLDRALPIVRRRRPATTVRVAGSQLNSKMRKLIGRYPDIDVLEDPVDAKSIWSEGRLLINPILTGSGVNMKCVEMLFCNAHIVTTTVGARGFPADIRNEFHIADTPESFAKAILALIDTAYEPTAGRLRARRRLGPSGINLIIEAMSELIGAKRADAMR
jgi:glycosyl transferase family 1